MASSSGPRTLACPYLHDQCHRVSQHEPEKADQEPGSFPCDEALTKLFYQAPRNFSQKWTMPIRD